MQGRPVSEKKRSNVSRFLKKIKTKIRKQTKTKNKTKQGKKLNTLLTFSRRTKDENVFVCECVFCCCKFKYFTRDCCASDCVFTSKCRQCARLGLDCKKMKTSN